MIAFTVTFNLAFRASPSCGCSISPLVQSWIPLTIVPSGKIWSIYPSKLFQLGNQMRFELVWVVTLGLLTAECVKSTRLKTSFCIFKKPRGSYWFNIVKIAQSFKIFQLLFQRNILTWAFWPNCQQYDSTMTHDFIWRLSGLYTGDVKEHWLQKPRVNSLPLNPSLLSSAHWSLPCSSWKFKSFDQFVIIFKIQSCCPLFSWKALKVPWTIKLTHDVRE